MSDNKQPVNRVHGGRFNVFWHECSHLRGSVITWAIVLAVLALVFVGLYPAFSHDMQTTNQILQKFPSAVRAAVGLSLDAMANFVGFYAYTSTYFTLAICIQALVVGLDVFSREDRTKTTDFLLAKPRSLSQLFWQKYAAGLAALVLSLALFTGSVLAAAQLYNVGNYDHTTFWLLQGALGMLQMVFYSLASAVTQIMRRIKSVTPLALAIGFTFFALQVVARLATDDHLRIATPFAWFDYMKIVKDVAYEPAYLLLTAAAIFLCTLFAYLRYRLRDRQAA